MYSAKLRSQTQISYTTTIEVVWFHFFLVMETPFTELINGNEIAFFS